MIGGDDDDIDALLEEVEAMADGPRLRQRGTGATSLPSGPSSVAPQRLPTVGTADVSPVQSSEPPPLTGLDQMAKMVDILIKQNQQLTEVVKGQQEERKKEEEIGSGKKKCREENSYNQQEPVLLFEEAYQIETAAIINWTHY